MDVTHVRKIYTTCNQHQANMLLRCNWLLLEAKDGKFVLGQVEKFKCPKCESEIDYNDVQISSMEGLHIINCPQCGKGRVPHGLTLDQYFVDKMTEYREDTSDEQQKSDKRS